MRLGVRLGNLLRLVLRLEVCLLQAKGLCSGSDIIFPSTLLRLGLGNKSDARPSVFSSWLMLRPQAFCGSGRRRKLPLDGRKSPLDDL